MTFNSTLPILSSLFGNCSEKEVNDDPKAELDNQMLWKEFSEFGTEMVITKVGRRMFPIIKVKLNGLDAKSKYIVMIEMVPSDQYRYKFMNGSWQVSGKCDFEPLRAPIVHPDSPQTGDHWMKMGASFKVLKLSNDHRNPQRHVFLNSMHRYHPRLHIVRCDQFNKAIVSTFKSFVFKYTDFMAVTAYQNEEVTRRKIENNPFAKGFRNQTNKKTQEKRKRAIITLFDPSEIKETPPASEDEEPESKRQRIETENPPLLNVSKISMELITQWQMAILSSFGNISNIPVLDKLIKNDVPTRKCGFGVVDLLGETA